MKARILMTLLLLTAVVANGFAHAFWVETASSGKKGVEQEVRVYFGEYSAQEITPIKEWFSDLKDFSLILLSPDNKKVKLELTAAGDYYSATFTPKSEGVYRVLLHHTAKDVYYGYKLDYNSSVLIQVSDGASASIPSSNPLRITPPAGATHTVNNAIDLSVFADKTITGEKSVEIVAPNGWIKKVYPNEEGEISFSPLWSGKYLVEMIIEDKTPGTHNGEEYKVDFRCATYMLEVE